MKRAWTTTWTCDQKDICQTEMPPTAYLLQLFLIFVRILAVLMTAPVFSSRAVPTIVKIGFAGLVAYLLAPNPQSATWIPGVGNPFTDSPTAWLSLVLVVGKETLIGVVLGFVSNLVFVIVAVAANLMGLQIGFRTANLFDPMTTMSTSALEQFYSMIVMLFFVTIDGHHWMLSAVSRSIEIAPLGMFVLRDITVERVIVLSGEILAIAVRMSLPVVASLLLTDLGLGVVSRAVPQMQVFFLGLPLKIGFGFVALALTLGLTLPLAKTTASDMVAKALVLVH